MSRRSLRLDIQLPDLAPAQAHLLWELFDELAYQISLAYEAQLFDFEAESFHAIEPRDEGFDPGQSTWDEPQAQLNDDSDPDF